MLIVSEIANALDHIPDLREYDRFQEMAFHLARSKWPGLRLTHKVHDRSADALDTENCLALACGWNGDLSKLKDDCHGLKINRPNIKKVVFATSSKVEEPQVLNWQNSVKAEFDLELIAVIHRDWMLGELARPEHRWIAHQYLRLLIGDFADMPTWLPRIKIAATQIISAWKLKYPSGQNPILDLRLVADGVNSKDMLQTELKVNNFPKTIHRGDFIWIAGQPGIGKTHSLVSIAEHLASSDGPIPILISLRDWRLMGGRLLDYVAAEPSMLLQGISAKTVATALEAGHLILLLNGWNEMPDEARLQAVADLDSILRQLAGATVVGTSRTIPRTRLPRPHLALRIDELSDSEMHQALVASHVPNIDNVCGEILSNSRISQLARVPLFLWELAAAAQSSHSLPRTRFELLHRSVERASQEHEEFLTIGGIQGLAARYLSAIARQMAEASQTVLSAAQARQIVMGISSQLQTEGYLSAPPPPPAILKQLTNCHLLFEEDAPASIRFSHQLFQEYFAALDLATTFADFPSSSFRSWAWAVPIQLAVEELCRQERNHEAAKFVVGLATADLEAACRAIGTNPTIWPHLQNEISAKIFDLAKINVNAQWLASRCAAATGRPEFADMVFGGLAGHPPGSESCFVGLPVESVFAALGPSFAARLLVCKEDAFRLYVLRQLAESGTRDGLLLAQKLAVSDQCQEVRLLAFFLIFAAGSKGWHRQFARKVVRQGGWTRELLAVAFRCPEVSLPGWRRRVARCLKRLTSLEERIKLQNMCYELDETRAVELAKAEYEWCRAAYSIEVPKEDEAARSYRRFCLRRTAKHFTDWTALKVIEEINLGDPTRLGQLPIGCLSQSQKDQIVHNHISYYKSVSPPRHDGFQLFATLSPKNVARDVLMLMLKPEYSKNSDNWNWVIYPGLRLLDRNDVLSVVSEPLFGSPKSEDLTQLVNALASTLPDERGRLREDVLGSWRSRLHEWIQLLPGMSETTAHLWSNAALLLGEMGHADDASLVLSWLQADHERVVLEQEEWRTAHESYRASGGGAARPSRVIPCSYENNYKRALWGFSGISVAIQIAKLIESPREMGFAANWVATHLGAPSVETFDHGRSQQNYELVSTRRVRSAEFAATAASTIAVLKTAIDRCANDKQLCHTDQLHSAFLALARLEGAPAGAWVIERLEQYFGDKTWEYLFLDMTLVGASFEGKRLLPFVRRTIQEVLHPQYPSSTDDSHRVSHALIALLFSDAPELAGQLLENEAAPVFQHKEFQIESLIHVSRWVNSPWVDVWLRSYFNLKNSERLRSTALRIAVERAADRQDFAGLRALAAIFIELGNLERSEGDWTIPRRLGEILSEYPEHRIVVINDALGAKTIHEARRWLRLLGGFETDQSVLVAFQLAERFGESHLNAVGALAPSHQEGTNLSFTGWGAPWKRNTWQNPAIVERLAAMSQSADKDFRLASENALFWLERERLTAGN